MVWFDFDNLSLVGSAGSLDVLSDDEITRKLAMLIEGWKGFGQLYRIGLPRYTIGIISIYTL